MAKKYTPRKIQPSRPKPTVLPNYAYESTTYVEYYNNDNNSSNQNNDTSCEPSNDYSTDSGSCDTGSSPSE